MFLRQSTLKSNVNIQNSKKERKRKKERKKEAESIELKEISK